MHEPDRIARGIDKVNGATIGNINSEANTALVCDQAITTVETLVPRDRLIDNSDAVSMHLLRGDKRRAAEPVGSSDSSMNAVQARQRLHFIM